ncbi:MAG: PKD domain-containing protein, partial [Verrucomicrobia bacterium]|nr:PKD domain-containing protein [Verrucomicrobiota bacterium]
VDPARIGVSGGSSGGHMAIYVALSGGLKTARIGSQVIDLVGNIGGNFDQSDVVQAAAPFFGPTDLLVMDHYPTTSVPDHNASSSPESNLIGAPIQTVPEKSATANPITLVRPGMPPFWITHGTNDTYVNFNQSELLNAALVAARQPVTFWPVQNGDHGPGVSDSQEVLSLMRVFLDRHLKGITTNQLPNPTFTASTFSGPAPLIVNFNGSASTDPDGIITKYSWSTGDDSGGGANVTLSYTYTLPGIYPVTLSVRDDQGGTSSVTSNITVTPAGTASAAPPTVTLTGPIDSFMFARTGDLIVQATAAATSPATVANVEFLLNGQSVAWDNKSPYIATFGQLAPGAYTAFARVSDSTGAATFSTPISFHVFGETDVFPQPSLTSGLFITRYYRFTDATLNYTFERSPDLATWTPFTPTESILINGTQVQQRSATDPLSTSGVDRRFLRIRISPAP